MSDTSIQLSVEAKERLERHKRPGESFEDVILRLTSDDKWAGFGALSDADGDLQEGMERVREEMREGFAQDIEEMSSGATDSMDEVAVDEDGQESDGHS
ncbi:antitoxin VapB family protein [Salinarchaeum chitinilyticum]